ncbi:MAG TPA: ACT domain-containing protein [Syntrophales bacterium]|jgi:hypothetical protein|nr:ACT domain-containing protein [Syntrophales bacterium]HOX94323.1 ACT domain-containing protein [Syntrophales bacterium]HPI56176.1 ACT domain-containing protein [Syntrophales bacterium]HPN24364.1 ACT domain-containing protein [Syntrophales bacterium]HQM28994.1 ACT domain-containing protein [Syntrophales bacterium]
MTVHQLSVFAENKPGQLARITRILSKEKVNIRATTIATSHSYGVINLIVDEPKRAQKALAADGLMVTMKEVVAVIIEDKPGGLDKLTQLLARENININNAYGFVLESWKTAVFVIDVDQMEKTRQLIKKAKFKTLDDDSLAAAEPFHYVKY